MNIHDIIEKLDDSEKLMYTENTASSYFRNIYYSKKFSSILGKLDSKDKLSDDEWQYLFERLYVVTYKAIQEEDSLSIVDKVNYVINRIGTKLIRKGKVHNESVKMLAFLESIKLECEINRDLTYGFDRVKTSRSETDLDILLKQHRESAVFRDNQDAFIDSYKVGQPGVMTNDDMLYMDCMDRAYIREKELVKEYK
ncbi:MAG: hypothetical protein IK137_01970 [Bacilli bacterium]|nr:hypothetical protein [Bacilli bacterium]